MNPLTLIVGPFLLGALIIGIEVTRKRRNKVDFLLLMNAAFFLFYALGPILLHTAWELGGAETWRLRRDLGKQNYMAASLLPLLSYIIMLAGFKFASKVRFNTYIQQRKISNQKLKLWAIILLSAGVIFYGVYVVKGVGSFSFVISNIMSLRGGELTERANQSLFFFSKLAGVGVGSSLLLFPIAISSTRRRNAGMAFWMLLAASILFSIIYFGLRGSRANLLIIIAIFYFSLIIARDRWPLKEKVSIVLAFFMFLLVGKTLFGSIGDPKLLHYVGVRMANLAPAVSQVGGDLAFPYVSVATAWNSAFADVQPRFFVLDWAAGLLALTPSLLLDFSTPEPLSTVHSKLVVIKDSKAGTIPVDIISYALYNGHIPGLVVLMFIFGFIAKRLELYLTRKIDDGVFVVLYIAWGCAFARAIIYPEPAPFFKTYLFLLIVTVIIIFNHASLRRIRGRF